MMVSVEDVQWRSEDTCFTILTAKSGDDRFTVVAPELASVGEKIDIDGEFIFHDIYGYVYFCNESYNGFEDSQLRSANIPVALRKRILAGENVDVPPVINNLIMSALGKTKNERISEIIDMVMKSDDGRCGLDSSDVIERVSDVMQDSTGEEINGVLASKTSSESLRMTGDTYMSRPIDYELAFLTSESLPKDLSLETVDNSQFTTLNEFHGATHGLSTSELDAVKKIINSKVSIVHSPYSESKIKKAAESCISIIYERDVDDKDIVFVHGIAEVHRNVENHDRVCVVCDINEIGKRGELNRAASRFVPFASVRSNLGGLQHRIQKFSSTRELDVSRIITDEGESWLNEEGDDTVSCFMSDRTDDIYDYIVNVVKSSPLSQCVSSARHEKFGAPALAAELKRDMCPGPPFYGNFALGDRVVDRGDIFIVTDRSKDAKLPRNGWCVDADKFIEIGKSFDEVIFVIDEYHVDVTNWLLAYNVMRLAKSKIHIVGTPNSVNSIGFECEVNRDNTLFNLLTAKYAGKENGLVAQRS